MRLVLASAEMLQAALCRPEELASVLGVEVPQDWPAHPHALAAAVEFLALFPEQAKWSTYFFVDDQAAVLVGSGGFKGAPADGLVEVGYEVAPTWQGQGMARAAVAELLAIARAHPDAREVLAVTDGPSNPSASVLRRLGFTQADVAPEGEPAGSCCWRLLV